MDHGAALGRLSEALRDHFAGVEASTVDRHLFKASLVAEATTVFHRSIVPAIPTKQVVDSRWAERTDWSALEVLAWVDELASMDRVDDALDVLYQWVDDRLASGDTDGCETFLRAVRVDQAHPDVLVGILTTTLPLEHLPARDALAKKIERKLVNERGKREAKAMLDGLW